PGAGFLRRSFDSLGARRAGGAGVRVRLQCFSDPDVSLRDRGLAGGPGACLPSVGSLDRRAADRDAHLDGPAVAGRGGWLPSTAAVVDDPLGRAPLLAPARAVHGVLPPVRIRRVGIRGPEAGHPAADAPPSRSGPARLPAEIRAAAYDLPRRAGARG